jgi:hypothetical protein
MIAFALAVLLSQPAPAPERGSGYEFVVPKGWACEKGDATKPTVLRPPDAKSDTRLILYPLYAVENGTYSNAEHFHVAMLQALTENAEKQGESVTGKTGAFQWSRVRLTVDGTEHRVAAYTAKLRSNWALVAFAGPTKAFETHLATVEEFVKNVKSEDEGKAVAAGMQEIHGLLLPLPEGWSRKDDPNGAIVLQPPAPKSERDPQWNYKVIVLTTLPMRGTLWETQRSIFDEVVKGSGLRNTVAPSHEPDAPGPFIRSATAGNDANGTIRAVRLYSARSEGGVECVVVFGGEDFATTGAILHGAKVRKPAKDAARPKIVAAYRRLSQQTHVEHFRGEQLIIAVPYDRIVLRADGVADFSPIHREGYAASRVPSKLDPALANGRYGSWKAVGDKEVHIVRQSDKPAEVYVRDGENLRLGDQGVRADAVRRRPRARRPLAASGRGAEEVDRVHAGGPLQGRRGAGGRRLSRGARVVRQQGGSLSAPARDGRRHVRDPRVHAASQVRRRSRVERRLVDGRPGREGFVEAAAEDGGAAAGEVGLREDRLAGLRVWFAERRRHAVRGGAQPAARVSLSRVPRDVIAACGAWRRSRSSRTRRSG